MTITGAGFGHDGRLVASCACGWTSTATAQTGVMRALLEHQRTEHETTTETEK